MISWVSIALQVLKLANVLFGWLHDRGVVKATEDRLFAQQIAEMARRSTTLKEIESRFSKMTPEEVIREIADHGDFRD